MITYHIYMIMKQVVCRTIRDELLPAPAFILSRSASLYLLCVVVSTMRHIAQY